jgi:hypothetical protein
MHILRALNKTIPVLVIRIWDNGFRFVYWIRPGRMGKNWKKIYAEIRAPHSYSITVDDYGVESNG